MKGFNIEGRLCASYAPRLKFEVCAPACLGDMDPLVRKQCDEIRLWRCAHGGDMPTRIKDPLEPEDLSRVALARTISNLKSRCSKALDDHPRGRQLNQDEVEYFEWCLSEAALDQKWSRPWARSGADSADTGSKDCPDSAAMAAVVGEKISYHVR